MLSSQTWKLQKLVFKAKTALTFSSKFAYSTSASPKTGILMMNLGGPKKSEDAGDFMYNMFTDEQTVPILKKVPRFLIRKI
jgi:hypothetical protein